eukprot:jgi/Undpi1/5168/HiC_scaffold_19.g08519.m1
MAPLQDPTSTLPQHVARGASIRRRHEDTVPEAGVKPDLRATTFSPLNAYFFAVLSKISYKTPSEAEGLLVGSSTGKGLGFDRFHWFEGGKEASKTYFDDIHETEAFIASNDDMIADVFRGSNGSSDWITNFKISWRACPAEWNLPSPGGYIHEGFEDGVNSVWLPTGMYNTIKSLYFEKGKNRKLYLAGHSLGGALATIAAGRLAFVDDMDIAGIYTIGCPRIFNQDCAKHFDAKINHGVALKDKNFRCRNNNDIVTRVPPFPYKHVGTEIYLDRSEGSSAEWNDHVAEMPFKLLSYHGRRFVYSGEGAAGGVRLRSGAVSKPDLMDRLLARLDSYRQGEFLDGANDHASTEYLRVLGLLARNSDVSPL